jgi:hypothetical protein
MDKNMHFATPPMIILCVVSMVPRLQGRQHPGHRAQALLCVPSTRFALLLDQVNRVVDEPLLAAPVQGGVIVDDSTDEVHAAGGSFKQFA